MTEQTAGPGRWPWAATPARALPAARGERFPQGRLDEPLSSELLSALEVAQNGLRATATEVVCRSQVCRVVVHSDTLDGANDFLAAVHGTPEIADRIAAAQLGAPVAGESDDAGVRYEMFFSLKQ